MLPKEGATGWADTWMMSSKAAHPNCMLKWMAYATTPERAGQDRLHVRLGAGQPAGLHVSWTSRQPNYCTDYHVTDPDYFNNISFWKTPLTDCGDDRGNTCVPTREWVQKSWT